MNQPQQNNSEIQRKKYINDLFSEIASSYDLLNDILSFGIHRRWKNKLVKLMELESCQTVVDLAGGTGDMARRIAAKNCSVILIDPNEEMLKIAAQKKTTNVRFICAAGEKIPLKSNSVDKLCIAFGIRNATNIIVMLKEIYRILKSDGKFYCLEFSKPNIFIRPFYRLYSATIIPILTRLFVKDDYAYRYLVESIKNFYDQQQLKKIIENVGFQNVYYKNLLAGITAIHIGRK